MKVRDVIAAVLVTMIWGFNFVAIQVGLGELPPLFFNGIRFLFAAFPAILFVGRGGIEWRWIISIGIFLGVLTFGLLYIGMAAGMPAGLSSVVMQIQVVFTLILSAILLKDTPSTGQVMGVILAIGGIVLLAVEKAAASSLLGILSVILSGFAWAVANILIKKAGDVDMFRLIVWMSVISPVPLFLLSALLEERQIQSISHISWIGVGAILYSSFLSTILAFGLWGKLFKAYSPSSIAPFALLVPFFGAASSALFLGERFTSRQTFAFILVIIGLVLVVLEKKLANARFLRKYTQERSA
ncbi:MAG: EamA family transporter [Anaerolineales bacterium]|nr:EamA family transporter [Anaerolineales bacterium]